jgi:hypothetical protein
VAETIETKDQFPDDAHGWAKRWAVELEGARKGLKAFHERGERVEDRYLSEAANDAAGTGLNLFFGDVEHKKALLYGNPPQVRSTRRHADPDDEEGRVAADMQGRLLNSDIQRRTDAFATALELARDDRLLPGLGVIRERYVVEMEDVPEQPAQDGPCAGCEGHGWAGPEEQVADIKCPACGGKGRVELAPAVPATQRKAFEDVETDYINWRDFLWSPARVWDEVTWVAFRAEMTREALHERFDETLGEDLVNLIPLNAKEKTAEGEQVEDPWSRASVWEVWHKDSRQVFWYVDGYDRILDRKDDPLGLDSFWPCPRPLFANVTSRKLVPKADLALHQDLYDAIDDLHERRQHLIKAIRVTGVFDGSNEGLAKVVEGGRNKLYPIDNWAAYVEKGGLAAGVQLMSLKEIIEAIDILTQKLQDAIALKDQAVGIADVMRGQATPGGGETATGRRIQARSASTRQKAAQRDFARFTTDAQNIRAEIIAKHFDPKTIIERSNILRTKDAGFAEKAAELIKSQFAQFRIEVAADGLAMTDYDAVKAERVEVVTALGGLMTAAQPIVQMGGPQALGFVLEVAGWLMAATPGGSQMEGVFDKYKAMAQQAAAQPKPPAPPDPKLQKAQVDLKAAEFKACAEKEATVMDLQVKKAEHQMDMTKLGMEMQRDMVKAAMPQPVPEGVA